MLFLDKPAQCSPLIQLFFGFASDIEQTNINREIRDGNWLSNTFGRSLVMIQEPDSNTTHFCLSKLLKPEGNCTCTSWELLLGRGGRRREESKAGQHKDSKVANDSKQRNYPSATGCHISVD